MRVIRSNRNWTELRWTIAEYDTDSEVIEATLDELGVIPGVRIERGTEWISVRAPRSVWGVPEFKRLAPTVKRPRIKPWAPRRPLYPHQLDAVDFLTRNHGGLLGDQMGLGKTASAIVALETLARATDPKRPRIILAPGYTRDVWRRELLALGAIDNEDQFTYALTRDWVKRGFDWAARWWFVHYDIAHAWAGALGGTVRRPVGAILDEIHWIKNGRAQRSRGANLIAGTATYRIGLSGTPIDNRTSELWWPLTVLDGPRSWGSPVEFRERYCGAYHDIYGLRDTGPTNTDELDRRLRRRYLRRTIESAGVELPPIRRELLRVPMDAKALEAHALSPETAKRLVDAVLGRRAGQDTLALIGRLRKTTSRAKLESTAALVTAAALSGESVVVFTWMRATAATLERKVAKALIAAKADVPTYTVDGTLTHDERDAVVQALTTHGEDPALLFATLDSLREGVTLTKATRVVMHDLDWVPSKILQAEARIWRIGQTRPCTSTWVVCEDSIDSMLAAALASKAEEMDQALGFSAAKDAVLDLDLGRWAASRSSVEDELARLIDSWEM